MALTPYQAHMKRELKGKMKGKTKAQRTAIFKAAAKSWKGGNKSTPKKGGTGSTPKSKSKGSKSKSSSSSKGGTKKMGKKGGFNTTKLFKVVRIGALAFPLIAEIVKPTPVTTKVYEIGRKYFAFNTATGKLDLSQLPQGYGPYAVASIITYGLPKLTSFIRSIF